MKKRSFIKIIAIFLCCCFSTGILVFAEDISQAAANDKIAANLSVKLSSQSNDESFFVYVYFNDDASEVLSTMKLEHADLYATYTQAQSSEILRSENNSESVAVLQELSTNDFATLQEAIETKRQLYSKYYLEQTTATLAKYCTAKSVQYVSSYAPMAIVSVTASELKEMALDPTITKLSLFENKQASVSGLANGNLTSRANVVRDTYGNAGAGVKIGQIEPGIPDTSDTHLSSANIITNTSFGGMQSTDVHATYVARIMVGLTGLAPSASLYSTSASYTIDHYRAIDWLVSQGVNVINMSANFYGDHEYNDFCAYIDHLAVQHDVHFVTTAGNWEQVDPNYYVCSPGLAYNVITVGAYNDNNTAPINDSQIYSTHKDDYLEGYSKYMESSSSGVCKPNLVASGNDFWGGGGTSYAAPQVTGVIAQLCSYNASLKTKQSSMGAILAASCGRKLAAEVIAGSELVYPSYFKGGTFINSVTPAYCNQISDTQGAGKLDAYWARSIISSGTYWSLTLDANVETYTKTVYITKGTETLSRVALFWLKKNYVDSQYNITQTAIADWDLAVRAPDGSYIATSMTYDNNYEIVQFVPPVSGNYTIELTRVTSPYNESSYLGFAVW